MKAAQVNVNMSDSYKCHKNLNKLGGKLCICLFLSFNLNMSPLLAPLNTLVLSNQATIVLLFFPHLTVPFLIASGILPSLWYDAISVAREFLLFGFLVVVFFCWTRLIWNCDPRSSPHSKSFQNPDFQVPISKEKEREITYNQNITACQVWENGHMERDLHD